jgi:general secretion pathway protein K
VRQRGVALVTAVVLVAIATVIAVRLGTRAALDQRRTEGLAALDQGWHVALGAEAWAAEILRDDLEDDAEEDHLGEAWAQPLPALPIDGGEVRGAIEDMQSRFNLNNLVKEGEPDEEAIGIFQRLLAAVDADPRWAAVMADWIDEDTIVNLEGAEDGTYLSQSPPYRAANDVITTTTELMALPGMTREEFEKIRPYVAALPQGSTINLCTAKAQVLTALIPSGASIGDEKLLATNRLEGCFPTEEVMCDLLGVGEESDACQDLKAMVDKRTEWFRATTAVRIGTSEFTLYSLIERTGNTSIRTVLRSTGTE